MPRLSLILLFSLLTGLLPAQPLSLFPPVEALSFAPERQTLLPLHLTRPASLLVSPQLLPRFVRENPRGYSYVCRLELEVEEKLPVGVWVRGGAESQPTAPWHQPAAAENYLYLRLRWHLFR